MARGSTKLEKHHIGGCDKVDAYEVAAGGKV